jgi:hypothetical protein
VGKKEKHSPSPKESNTVDIILEFYLLIFNLFFEFFGVACRKEKEIVGSAPKELRWHYVI